MISEPTLFKLNKEEYKKLNIWWKKNFMKKNFGAIGGGLTFHVTPTSIGDVIVAECCKKKLVLREL